MYHSSPPNLRLITDSDKMLDFDCSDQSPSREADSTWELVMHTLQQIPRPSSALSDSSYYTAQTSDSHYSESSSSSVHIITVQMPTSLKQRSPPLRRKMSPTAVSLRELRAEQSRRDRAMRAQQSEEQLQRLYECQIQAYLDGQFADLHSIIE